MSARMPVHPLIVEQMNATESWVQFRKRLEIGAISLDVGKRIDADDEQRVAKMSKAKGSALLSAVGPERMEVFIILE